MNLEGIIQIGEIISTHGIKGELKVLAMTSNPEIFLELDYLILIANNQRRNFSVINSRTFKNYWLIQLEDVNDIKAAQKLKGFGLYLEEEKLSPLAVDEFFIHDLLKARVYSTDNQYLGIISNYFETGAQGVCEVTHEQETFLFPTSHEILKEIIPPDKVIINLVPGLRDLNS